VSLVISVIALAVAAYAVTVSDSSGEAADAHRCASAPAKTYNTKCLADDTPRDWEGRGCVPLYRQAGVFFWDCQR